MEGRTRKCFNTLKEKLTNAPILKCADPSLPYEITSDASDTGVGAVLSQKDDKGSRPIAYTSRKLSPTEQDYSTPEKELLGIIHALQTRRSYLHGAKFVINTDHHPLKYLDTQKTLSRKQARWVEFMQEFDYSINYMKGKSNVVADALSRQHGERHYMSTEFIRKLLLLTKVSLSNEVLNNLEKRVSIRQAL